MLNIGAGCVAQVFKGSLTDKKTDTKQPVAIKLIHPHVENMIKTDMELLGFFASFIDKFESLKILSLGKIRIVIVIKIVWIIFVYKVCYVNFCRY